MKSTIVALALAIALTAAGLGYASTAAADVELASASPAPGSAVTTSPPSVVLTFDSEIQKIPGSFDVQVTSSAGTAVTSGPAAISDDGLTLSVGLQPNLEHGVYTVSYTNTSAGDGHKQTSSFTFTVGDSAAPGDEAPDDDDDDGHEHNDAAPTPAPAPDHDEGGAGHDEATGEPLSGLVVAVFTPRDGSGISGRLEVLAVDGGSRTQFGVYLSGVGADAYHANHVHVQESCAEAPGPHAADLPDSEPNGQGYARSVATFDIPFAQVANGGHVVNVHAGPTGGDKAIVACAEIPAVATGPAGPVALPDAGDGTGAGHATPAALVLLLGAGVTTAAAGATLRRVAVKA